MSGMQGKILNPKEKAMVEDIYMIGKLYDDEHSFRRAIGPNSDGSYRFYLEALSSKPPLIQQMMDYDEMFISYDNRQYNYLNNYGYWSVSNKEEKLREILKNKLLIFKPQIVYNKKTNGYFYNFEIAYEDTLESKEAHSSFYVIPSFDERKQTIEEKLRNGNIITLSGYNHANELPRYVVNEDTLYIFEQGSLVQYGARVDAYKCEKPESVRICPLPPQWEELIKGIGKSICFLSTIHENMLKEHLKNHGKPLVEEKIEEKVSIEVKKEVPLSVKSIATAQSPVQETAFLQQVYANAIQHGLMYKLQDIVNLHTSLKSGIITILGGMSGTGKTQLARTYGETMGLVEGDTLLTISVSPSFTEPSDLLGFLNHQTGQYIEAETGLVSFLHRAQQHPEEMHMVIFDEMNIGQVEHYFSDFISLLELPLENRVLHLFSPNSVCQQEYLCEGIKIGENILFVGTANFDETTKDFSNRMLDRSNVLLLERLRLAEAKQQLLAFDKEVMLPTAIPISADTYQTWVSKEEAITLLSDEQLALLDALHDEMHEYDSQMGVSFRMINGIVRFLHNIPVDEQGQTYLSQEDALDYQIKQRILTKIRGHREQIEHLVGSYNYEGDYEAGSLMTILENEQIFPVSRAYVKQKAKELMRNGYTL